MDLRGEAALGFFLGQVLRGGRQPHQDTATTVAPLGVVKSRSTQEDLRRAAGGCVGPGGWRWERASRDGGRTRTSTVVIYFGKSMLAVK